VNNELRDEIVIYRTKDGKTALEVNLREDTVWLSQVQMSELFAKDRRTISEHINNVFKEKELSKNRTIRKFRIVQKEGDRTVPHDCGEPSRRQGHHHQGHREPDQQG